MTAGETVCYNDAMKQELVFSGLQPTGMPHIGNYFGAIKQWVELQKDHSCLFCVVDWHALTVEQDPKKFSQQTLDAATTLLAAGVDPTKAPIFIQSSVPEHTELSWIFTTLVPVAELERMTQYKDKSQENRTNINTGLLMYPVLMAADILLYKGTLVPVGEDQVQHVELARIISRKFNNRYGNTLPEPKPKLTKAMRIMSLLDPAKKMSKSHGEKSYIALTDEPEIIKQKLARAVTATAGGGTNPGVQNLLAIMREVSDTSTVQRFEEQEKGGTIKYSELKAKLADDLAEHLSSFREKYKDLQKHSKDVLDILESGRKKASAVAQKTMAEVRAKIGMLAQ